MNKKGFSFLELAIVVLILAIIFAMSVNHYLKAKRNGQRTICIQNMKILDIAVENHRMSGEEPVIPQNVQYLGEYKDVIKKYLKNEAFPICSEGGFYSIENGNLKCSEHGFWITEASKPFGGDKDTQETESR